MVNPQEPFGFPRARDAGGPRGAGQARNPPRLAGLSSTPRVVRQS